MQKTISKLDQSKNESVRASTLLTEKQSLLSEQASQTFQKALCEKDLILTDLR